MWIVIGVFWHHQVFLSGPFKCRSWLIFLAHLCVLGTGEQSWIRHGPCPAELSLLGRWARQAAASMPECHGRVWWDSSWARGFSAWQRPSVGPPRPGFRTLYPFPLLSMEDYPYSGIVLLSCLCWTRDKAPRGTVRIAECFWAEGLSQDNSAAEDGAGSSWNWRPTWASVAAHLCRASPSLAAPREVVGAMAVGETRTWGEMANCLAEDGDSRELGNSCSKYNQPSLTWVNLKTIFNTAPSFYDKNSGG